MQNSAPPSPAAKMTEKQFREELDALNKQSVSLNEQRIRIQTEIERARKEKEELEASLATEFGTSDLEELAGILRQRVQANQEALALYKAGILTLSDEINEVSAKLALIK